jgi:hypothetical protein
VDNGQLAIPNQSVKSSEAYQEKLVFRLEGGAKKPQAARFHG